MPKPPLIHLDSPIHRPLGDRVLVRGWVASDVPLVAVRARVAQQSELLAWELRPDVREAQPHFAHTSGFRGYLRADFSAASHLVVDCETAEGSFATEKTLASPVVPPDKPERLQRIRPFLKKNLPFKETPFHFNFLTPEAAAVYGVEDTEAVSSFEYAPEVSHYIASQKNELILDCGAGCRPTTYPNVVNLEIVPYASTDIVSVNEELPFEDGTFSMVISCAVLEHVKDPFASAREIVRVLKPGGVVYADIPFLQPFHGYPSHYYNMTMEGAKNLFSSTCRIEREFVPHYGLPIWALTWFLKSYRDGLPDEIRANFLNLRIADLMAPAVEYLDRDWVRGLPAQKNIELACMNTVIARKL